MDVIPSAALNQYLITDTEERLECVSVCVCEGARRSETGYQVGMEAEVRPSNATCVTALVRLFDFKMCVLLLGAVTLLLHQIFHTAPTDRC